MNKIKLSASLLAACGALLLSGCESGQSGSNYTTQDRVFTPGHLQGYRSASGGSAAVSSKSGTFSPGHLQGYQANISGHGSIRSTSGDWPSHINGY